MSQYNTGIRFISFFVRKISYKSTKDFEKQIDLDLERKKVYSARNV